MGKMFWEISSQITKVRAYKGWAEVSGIEKIEGHRYKNFIFWNHEDKQVR